MDAEFDLDALRRACRYRTCQHCQHAVTVMHRNAIAGVLVDAEFDLDALRRACMLHPATSPLPSQPAADGGLVVLRSCSMCCGLVSRNLNKSGLLLRLIRPGEPSARIVALSLTVLHGYNFAQQH